MPANEAGSVRKPIGTVRAKRAHLQVEKHDKAGRRYVGQQDVILSRGAHSAIELQHEIDRIAQSSDEKVIAAQVEYYGPNEVPLVSPVSRNAELGQKGDTWGGFRGAVWPPESPRVRAIQARQEVRESGETG